MRKNEYDTKYIDNKEELIHIEYELEKISKNIKRNLKVFDGIILLILVSIFLSKFLITFDSSFMYNLSDFSSGLLLGLGAYIYKPDLCTQKYKRKINYLNERKIQLETEIEEDELKEKVKSLSYENKKVLQNVMENPEVQDVLTNLLDKYESMSDNCNENILEVIYSDAEKSTEKEINGSSLSIGKKEK